MMSQNIARGPFIRRCSAVAAHPLFSQIIMGLIFINGILLGLETYPSLFQAYERWFYLADRVLLWIFTVEIVIRLLAVRPYHQFFKEGWNLFDFIIVLSGHIFAGAHFVTVLRILRVLRVLRVISIIPSLRKMVNALLLTIPSMGNILLLLTLFFYIYSVLGTVLYADVAPEYFGTLHSSLFTLFQVVTLESWASAVARPVISQSPWAWLYFISFILIGTFVIFNLFVGVIINNLEQANHEESSKENDTRDLEGEVQELRKEISELKEWLIVVNERERKSLSKDQ